MHVYISGFLGILLVKTR